MVWWNSAATPQFVLAVCTKDNFLEIFSTGSNAPIWFSLLRNLYLGLISAEVGKVRHALKGDGEWDSATEIWAR